MKESATDHPSSLSFLPSFPPLPYYSFLISQFNYYYHIGNTSQCYSSYIYLKK